MTQKPRICYSYLRFSDPKQRKGSSTARQNDLRDRIIKKNGWQLDTTLQINDPGRSGFHGPRKGLAAFLKAISDGTVEPGAVLIVEKLDRLTRSDIDEGGELFKNILRAGVDICTCEPERLYTAADLKLLSVGIEIIVTLSLNHEQSKKLSDRLLYCWEKRRADGWRDGLCPAWLVKEKDGYKILKEKAKIVNRIYDWSLAGKGARVITKLLNRKRIENIAYGKKVICKKIWNQQFVENILRTPAVIGHYQRCKLKVTDEGKTRVKADVLPIKDYFPRIMPDEKYYAVQAARGGRNKTKGPVGYQTANLFSGLIFDEKGSTMRIVNSSQNDKKKKIMRRVANYHGVDGADDFRSWPLCQFEEHFLHTLRSEITSGKLKPPKAKRSALPALQAKRAELEGSIAEVQQLVRDGGTKARAVYELLTQLDSDREELLAEIETERANDQMAKGAPTTNIVSIIGMLESCGDDEREELRERLKVLIRQVVSKIVVQITDIEGNRLKKELQCYVSLRNKADEWFYFFMQSWKGSLVDKYGAKLYDDPPRLIETGPSYLADLQARLG